MSQPGSTVCSMAPLMPTCDAGGRYARERRAARRSDRAGAFFHNPAITLLVLRRLRASHQVLRFSARRDRDADVEQRPKAKSPLGSRTADQRTTGDWKRSQNRPMPHSGPAVRSGRQPFQGGGTGSNPVGGAKRNSSSLHLNRIGCDGRDVTSITSSITLTVPSRPRVSLKVGDYAGRIPRPV